MKKEEKILNKTKGLMKVNDNLKPLSYRIDFSALNGINVQCNLNCPYCHHDYFLITKPFNLKQTMDFVDSIKLLDSIIGEWQRPRKIHLSGRAEPLVVEQSLLFSEIKKLSNTFPHYDFVITTNGILLEDYASELIKSGVKRFNVSMHYKINRNSKIIKGIMKAAEEGAEIVLNVMISKGTIENFEEIVDFAGENNFKIKLFYELEIPETEMRKQLSEMNKKLISLTGTQGVRNSQKNRLEFLYHGAKIEVKQLEDEFTRPSVCNTCPFLNKCKEGCWDSIRITPWYIKPCGVREDNVYFFTENSPKSLESKLYWGGKINRQIKKEVVG